SYYQNQYARMEGKILDYVLKDIGEQQFFTNKPIKEVKYQTTPKEVKVMSRPVSVERSKPVVSEKPKPFVSEKSKPNFYEKPNEVKKNEQKSDKSELQQSIENNMNRLDGIINDLEKYKNRK